MKQVIAPEASTDWDNSIFSPRQIELILASCGLRLSDRYAQRAYEMVLVQRTTQLCWTLFDKNPAPAVVRNFSTQLEKLFISVDGAACPAPRRAYEKLQSWAGQELSRPDRTRRSRYHSRAIPWLVAFFKISFGQSELKAGQQSPLTLFTECYFNELNQALKVATLEDPERRGRTAQPFALRRGRTLAKAIRSKMEYVAQEEPIVHLDLAAATERIGVKGN